MSLALVLPQVAKLISTQPHLMVQTDLDGLMPGVPQWHCLRGDVHHEGLHVWVSSNRYGQSGPWQVLAHTMTAGQRESTLLGVVAEDQLHMSMYRHLLIKKGADYLSSK